MSIYRTFYDFCSNLKMSQETVKTISTRYDSIIKRINSGYWSNSSISHGLYVGSYGRDTEIWTSDIDIIAELPPDIYWTYKGYSNNGPSSLIQHVKESLKITFSQSKIRGDGQVIIIDFSDGITFEIVPAFLNKDESTYTYPDSNNGGTWKVTYPRQEIKAINDMNNDSNKNLKKLCRMARAWKRKHSVDISGILIDTLAYEFIDNWEYKKESYCYYDYITRDFFKFLKDKDIARIKWTAPGSNRILSEKNNFHYKANKAYNLSIEAIQKCQDINTTSYSSKKIWREIYGTKFPE